MNAIIFILSLETSVNDDVNRRVEEFVRKCAKLNERLFGRMPVSAEDTNRWTYINHIQICFWHSLDPKSCMYEYLLQDIRRQTQPLTHINMQVYYYVYFNILRPFCYLNYLHKPIEILTAEFSYSKSKRCLGVSHLIIFKKKSTFHKNVWYIHTHTQTTL